MHARIAVARARMGMTDMAIRTRTPAPGSNSGGGDQRRVLRRSRAGAPRRDRPLIPGKQEPWLEQISGLTGQVDDITKALEQLGKAKDFLARQA